MISISHMAFKGPSLEAPSSRLLLNIKKAEENMMIVIDAKPYVNELSRRMIHLEIYSLMVLSRALLLMLLIHIHNDNHKEILSGSTLFI